MRPGFYFWIGKIPWRREWQPTPVFLPGEFHQRSLAGYCSWVCKATNTFILHFHNVQSLNEELGRKAHIGLSLTDRNWLQHISAFSVSLCNWFCLQPETPLCVSSGYGHWALSGCSPVDAQSEKREYLSSLLPVVHVPVYAPISASTHWRNTVSHIASVDKYWLLLNIDLQTFNLENRKVAFIRNQVIIGIFAI